MSFSRCARSAARGRSGGLPYRLPGSGCRAPPCYRVRLTGAGVCGRADGGDGSSVCGGLFPNRGTEGAWKGFRKKQRMFVQFRENCYLCTLIRKKFFIENMYVIVEIAGKQFKA